MDETVLLADRDLRSLELGPVVYEPDGNVPPDFAIDGSIAVEVRRLNQNYEEPDGAEGLEELRIPLLRLTFRRTRTPSGVRCAAGHAPVNFDVRWQE